MTDQSVADSAVAHPHEPHTSASNSRKNWLRAAVLGANDGIVSVAGLVVGVAGATTDKGVIFTAGLAGLIAGALSMAAGEYVSVSAQRDVEASLLSRERRELEEDPEAELQELAQIYQSKGLSKETAIAVSRELTEHDAFAAHVDAELGIDPDDLTDPWQAAFSSALAFLAGAILPLVVILLPLGWASVPATFIAVVFALGLTGYLSAKFGEANVIRAVRRVVAGGALAMIVTYIIGSLFGISGV